MSDLLARLIAAGTPADLIAEVAMLAARAEVDKEAIEARRSKDRDRQAARRHVTSRDIADVADVTLDPAPLSSPLSFPPDPQTNPPYNPPTPTNPVRAKSSGFGPPAKVSTEAWDGFCKQRKKRMTQIAFDGIVERLAEHTNDLWPPDRLVRLAIERGHETIWPPPKDERNGRPAITMGRNGLSASGHGSVVDSAQRVIARHQAAAGR